jgi:serine/threonine-protein kinase RsbW
MMCQPARRPGRRYLIRRENSRAARRVTRMRQQVMTGEMANSGNTHGPGELRDSCWAWEMALPAAGQAAGLARQATREVLTSWQVAHLEDTAVLFVSELVTNAVRHACSGGSVLVLRLEAAGTSLRIEVHDADPQWPQRGTPTGLDESGFGFVIVDALADKWGVSETATGKAVWAELDTRPGHQPG